MTKFTAKISGGRTLVGLGLSAGNVRLLKEGKPIHINLEELNLPYRVDVMIHYGETEQDLADGLSQYITPSTIVHRGDPK